jgi:hypothetical protein
MRYPRGARGAAIPTVASEQGMPTSSSRSVRGIGGKLSRKIRL